MTEMPQLTDPWRGIKRGDRFWIVGWNVQQDMELWEEVTDLWFDPVRGDRHAKRGYVVAVRLMGNGKKRMLAASTLAGKRYQARSPGRRLQLDARRALACLTMDRNRPPLLTKSVSA